MCIPDTLLAVTAKRRKGKSTGAAACGKPMQDESGKDGMLWERPDVEDG